MSKRKSSETEYLKEDFKIYQIGKINSDILMLCVFFLFFQIIVLYFNYGYLQYDENVYLFRTKGSTYYPLYSNSTYWFSKSHNIVPYIANIVYFQLTIILLWKIVDHNIKAIFYISPVLFVLSTTLYPESMFALLLTLTVYLVKLGKDVLASIVAFLGYLAKTSGITIILALLIYGLFLFPKEGQQKEKRWKLALSVVFVGIYYVLVYLFGPSLSSDRVTNTDVFTDPYSFSKTPDLILWVILGIGILLGWLGIILFLRIIRTKGSIIFTIWRRIPLFERTIMVIFILVMVSYWSALVLTREYGPSHLARFLAPISIFFYMFFDIKKDLEKDSNKKLNKFLFYIMHFLVSALIVGWWTWRHRTMDVVKIIR